MEMEDYDEVALRIAEDWVVGYAEFLNSWVADGGWAGDAAQAWGERWAAPEQEAPEPPSRPERQDWW